MRESAYELKNSFNQNLELINLTKGINLIDFIENKNLSYSKFEKSSDGKFSPNKLNFSLEFSYGLTEVETPTGSIMYIDSDILQGILVTDLQGDISSTPSFSKLFPVKRLAEVGDEFLLLQDGYEIFRGIVEDDGIDFNRNTTSISFDISIEDRTSLLYEKKYTKNYLFRDMFLANNLDKNNSLIHQLGYLLGFLDEEMLIDDIKDQQGNLIKIPFVHLKQDEQIIKDLAEAVRLVNSSFLIVNNKLTVRINRTTETYVFDNRNIKKNINIKEISAKYDKVKITFDRYFSKDIQDMWVLQGQNGNLNNANIKILAGDTRKFKVTWFHNVGFVSNYEVHSVEFNDINGNPINFPYNLKIDETGGLLELSNTTASDVWCKSFKIKGIPLFMQGDNQSYYPGQIESDRILDNTTNKFVQTTELSLLFAHFQYEENCKNYKTFSFQTHAAHFLEPGVKILLDHEDFSGYVVIEKINFKSELFDIEAREIVSNSTVESIETFEKTNADELEVISNKYLADLNLYEKDKPPIPSNLILESMPLGFAITFDRPQNVSLKGHYIYIKKQSDIDWRKVFANTNYYFYQTTQLVTYEVKVANVSINGIEGDTTKVKVVMPLLIENNVVDYEEGLSPTELDEKVQNINTIISDVIDEVDLHEVNIELIESEIISMKKKDDDNFTAITQNAEQIQSIAQEVETKTTASEVETITHTAIESFSANEFRRTLGTRVSIIDYSKNIDEIETLDIDSAELEEVMIEEYYSSIYQNARQILALIKNSDEQYSVIQQLANQITLLVQEDSKNYSIIEQLANELSFVVKKDNLISSINQTAEEIKINAQRIALGSGLVVEDDKVAVKSVFGLNFGLGIGVLGNQDGLILQSDNFRLYANTTTGDFDLLATGNIEFKNAKNRIYLDKENGLSQIILKANWSNNGVMLPEFEGVDFQIGEVGSSKGYFKFDDDEGVSMDIKNLKIGGNSILNTVKTKSTAGMTGVYNGSNYAGKSAFGHNVFNDGWYITCDRRAPNSTVDYFEVFLNLYNVAPTYDINGFAVDEIASKIYAICAVTSGERSSYRIYRSEYQPDSNATLIFQSASYGTSNNISRDVNAIYANNGNIGLYYNIVIFNPDVSKITNELHRYYNGIDTLIHKTVGSNSNNEIKKVLFTLGNRLFFKKNNLLYYTTDNFSTETLFYEDNVGIYNYYLLKNQIYAYKYTPSNILLKLDNNSGAVIESYILPDQPIDGVSNIKDFASNSNYFYIIGYDNFLMTKDFNEYTRVYKDTSDDYVCVLENKTFILKPRANSSKSDIYRMIGFNFGTLVY